MKRKIVQGQCQVKVLPTDSDLDLAEWFLEQSHEFGPTTLLAHADDGVIWGQVREGKLHLASEHFPEVSPPLRATTLLDGWLFGLACAAHLWRDEDGRWQARLVQDGVGPSVERCDEYQMLWGTQCEDEQGGFALVSDGEMKHRHAPPVTRARLRFRPDRQRRPLRLQIRHYLAHDENTGLTHIGLSRLVAVLPDTEVER